jgi:hypothetical protein
VHDASVGLIDEVAMERLRMGEVEGLEAWDIGSKA